MYSLFTFREKKSTKYLIIFYTKMQDGMAEVFGTEMVRGKEYQFGPGTKMAIFTYHGCAIVIKGIYFCDIIMILMKISSIARLQCLKILLV